MTAIAHTTTQVTDPSRKTSLVVAWPLLTSGNSAGDALEMSAWSDRSVHFTGTFGSATAVLQGSNDNVNWVTLKNLQGTAITGTATYLMGVAEITRYMRPSTSGGDGTQSITCTVLITGYRGN